VEKLIQEESSLAKGIRHFGYEVSNQIWWLIISHSDSQL